MPQHEAPAVVEDLPSPAVSPDVTGEVVVVVDGRVVEVEVEVVVVVGSCGSQAAAEKVAIAASSSVR
jgi:hypothetical protein